MAGNSGITVGGMPIIRASTLRASLRRLSDHEGLAVTRGAAGVTVGPVDSDGGRPVTFRLGRDTFAGRLVEGARKLAHGGAVWLWQCPGCRHTGYVARAVAGRLVCHKCSNVHAEVWARRTAVERAAQRLLRAELDAARAGQTRTRGPAVAAVRAARSALQKARTDVARAGLARLKGTR